MMIKTQDGEKNVASKGLGGAALGLAIPGTVALVNQLAGGAWGLGRAYSGNNGCGCGEVTHDTRVISALESELARVNSERYADMMESFNSFLFEKFKEGFSAVPAFQPTIERYVNTILESSQEYGKRTKELEEENKRLKQQLEEALNANGHTAE